MESHFITSHQHFDLITMFVFVCVCSYIVCPSMVLNGRKWHDDRWIIQSMFLLLVFTGQETENKTKKTESFGRKRELWQFIRMSVRETGFDLYLN